MVWGCDTVYALSHQRGSESCCVLWRSELKELLKNVLLLEQLEEGDKDVGLKNVTESLGYIQNDKQVMIGPVCKKMYINHFYFSSLVSLKS
ncbi:hypothetical protein LXL04_036952 [Taraxacum kok-saghyz]